MAFLTARGTFTVAFFGNRNFFLNFITMNSSMNMEISVNQYFTKGIFVIYQLPSFALYYTFNFGVLIIVTLLLPKQKGVKHIRIGHWNSFIRSLMFIGIFFCLISVSIWTAIYPLKLTNASKEHVNTLSLNICKLYLDF